jgi:hypothetical protein
MPPRKRAAPRAAAKKPRDKPAEQPQAAEQPPGFLQPVVIGSNEDTPVERITIFTIDDVPYTIPSKWGPQRGLQFLRESSNPTVGFRLAVDHLAMDLIGEENLLALERSPKTTAADIAQVFNVVRQLVLGGPTVMEQAAKSGNS